MKKILFFLAAILINQASAFAQFTNVWKKFANGTDYTWFTSTSNDVSSLAYNPATDKLLVTNRNTDVYIINAATGAQEGTLSKVGLGTESYKFAKIRVDANGVIYGISLVLGASPSCKIYRWASQAANPVECASFAVTERTGDSFGLSGTGANTVLYAGGAGITANAFNIYILSTTDGLAFTAESKVTMTSSPTAGQGWANRTVEPVGTGVNSDIWINGGGQNARRISISAPTAGVRTGTVVTTIADGTGAGQASVGYGGTRYITGALNKFLVFAGGNNLEAGTVMRALNVNDETAITTLGTESLYATTSYVTNSNGTGDVSFKVNSDGSFTTFYLSTNNGIGATLSAPGVLPVSLTSFNASFTNNQNSLTWSTATESNSLGFEVESSIDGATFSKIDFVPSKNDGNSSTALTYIYQDKSATSGTTYYRLKQVDKDGKFEYSEVKFVKSPLSPEKNNFRVYPNPTTDYVEIAGADAEGVIIALFNTAGKELPTKLVNGRLSMNNLNAGLYVLRISKNGQVVQTTKLVKN